jgi:trk system potassium uptake protein TrkA
VTKEHGKILSHLGANRVVFPEEEVAKELADKSSWPNVLDFLPIDPEYSVVEITVPESLEGKTLAEADLRNSVGVFVLGLRDVMQGRFQMFPEGRTKLIQDQILLVIGREEELARLREMN